MPVALQLAEQRFGRLIAVEPAGRTRAGLIKWRCQCDCGGETVATASNLRTGNTRSCGCLMRERSSESGRANMTHGESHSPTYRSWQMMVYRCVNPSSPDYPAYGGRGIKVCDRWRNEWGYIHFREDMGERPKDKTLDRIDNEGDYGPENCKWSTRTEQARNRRLPQRA